MCLLRFFSPARWAHFQAAAKEYAAKHNGENYFSALNKVSRSYHLKVKEFIRGCLVMNTINKARIYYLGVQSTVAEHCFGRDGKKYKWVSMGSKLNLGHRNKFEIEF